MNKTNSLNTSFQVDNETDLDEIGVVPHVAILVVCAAPVLLLVFPFKILVTMDSFLIAFSMLLQLGFYVYAKHGRAGHYARHPADQYVFHVPGGLWATLLITALPLVVVAVLVVAQGLLPLAIFAGCQLALFGLAWIEKCVARRNGGATVLAAEQERIRE